MDYIVFGTGYGATLLVLGWILRTFGPGLRHRAADPDAPARADELVHRMAWTRFAEALGMVVAMAGAAIIVLTFLTALINPGDHAGAIVLWICFLGVIIGAAIWTWFYVARFGAEGLMPERLDIARLLERRERPFSQPREDQVHATGRGFDMASRAPAAPASPFVSTDDDAQAEDSPFDDYDEDDEHDAEMAVRYSRYQVHHPDEGDAYRGLFSMYGVDAPEFDEGELAEDSSEPGGEIAFPEHEAGPVEPEAPHTDTALDDREAAEFPGDGIEPEDDVPEAEGDEEPVFDAEAPLPDTPEGRAEALRRLQMWEPDTES